MNALIDKIELGPSQVAGIALSPFCCVECAERLEYAVIGRSKKLIYRCPNCGTLYLVPWHMPPYFDADERAQAGDGD